MSYATSSRGQGRAALRAAAIGLGVFSLGLGLAELLAPRGMARATGLRGRETLLRAYGLREIATGIGLLTAADPAPWLWARVAGDALDVSTLAMAAVDGNPDASRARAALLAVAPVGMADVASALLAQSRDDARRNAAWDYSDRSGFPLPAERMRGAARDAVPPPDVASAAPLLSMESAI